LAAELLESLADCPNDGLPAANHVGGVAIIHPAEAEEQGDHGKLRNVIAAEETPQQWV
jgi:hypothetical protein